MLKEWCVVIECESNSYVGEFAHIVRKGHEEIENISYGRIYSFNES
jgi:hypothetical protein